MQQGTYLDTLVIQMAVLTLAPKAFLHLSQNLIQFVNFESAKNLLKYYVLLWQEISNQIWQFLWFFCRNEVFIQFNQHFILIFCSVLKKYFMALFSYILHNNGHEIYPKYIARGKSYPCNKNWRFEFQSKSPFCHVFAIRNIIDTVFYKLQSLNSNRNKFEDFKNCRTARVC